MASKDPSGPFGTGKDLDARARQAAAFANFVRPDLLASVPPETVQRIAKQMLSSPELLAEFEKLFEAQFAARKQHGVPGDFSKARSFGWDDGIDNELKPSQAAAGAAAGVAAAAAGPAGAAAVVAV